MEGLEFVGFALLTLPLFWELYDDRNGDSGKITVAELFFITEKVKDVFIRGFIALVVSVINYFMIGIPIHESLLASLFGFHFLIFDYAINYIYGHSNWFSYLGKTSKFDAWELWRGIHPFDRFLIRLFLSFFSFALYFNLI
jgi:hypothetical protein